MLKEVLKELLTRCNTLSEVLLNLLFNFFRRPVKFLLAFAFHVSTHKTIFNHTKASKDLD